MDLVWHGLDQGTQEVGRGAPRRLGVKLGVGKLAGPIDGNEQMELAPGGLHLGNVNVKEADQIGFEPFFAGLSPSISGRRRCRGSLKAAV